jgi:hypothetical protein
MKFNEIAPVVVSVLIIVGVAVLEKQSKLVAAVTATMPIKVPLSLWVVYAASNQQQESIQGFSKGLMVSIVPTLGFIVAAWLAARAGMDLIPVILIGYAVWGVGVGLTFLLRPILGV